MSTDAYNFEFLNFMLYEACRVNLFVQEYRCLNGFTFFTQWVDPYLMLQMGNEL
jgi:hypothetical protein